MCLGIPGKIVAIDDASRKLGVVDVGGVQRIANLACVLSEDHPIESCVGDWVLVHVGFAMSRIDEQEAQRTLALLQEMGEVMEFQESLKQADQSRGEAGSAGAALNPPLASQGSQA